MQGAIEMKENKDPFEFPVDFQLDQQDSSQAIRFAVMDIRKGKGQALRSLSTSIQDLGEWDQVKIPIYTIESLTAQILWHGEDVFVHEPSDLVENIVAGLEALVSNHE